MMATELSLAPPGDVSWGLLPRVSVYRDGSWPAFEDHFTVLPRSQWQEVRNRRHVKTIYSQLDGMCAANAAAGALMVLRDQQGQPHKVMSPENLYSQHSNWGTGSTLEENLRCLAQVGVCDRDTVPQANWRPSSWPKDWKANAKRYRVLEWWDLGDVDAKIFDAMASALQLGFVVVIGLNWPGGGGHSVLATDLVPIGSGWGVEGPNSWGEDWGERGFYQLSESQCRSMTSYGCWAGRSCVIPTGE